MKLLAALPFLLLASTVTAQNVGIGTPNPQAKLHLTSGGNEVIRMDASNPFISLFSDGIYQGYLWRSPSTIEVGSAAGTNLPVTLAPDGIQRFIVTPTGNVGIGVSDPNAPLAFPALLGKKITLYPGASGDVGFGVEGNRLMIYSDHSNADVAIGFDNNGIFNERFAFKPNGAIAINGNTGMPGQVLQNNAAGVPEWTDAIPKLYTSQSNGFVWNPNGGTVTQLPGVSLVITLTRPSTLNISAMVTIAMSSVCFSCSAQPRMMRVLMNGGILVDIENSDHGENKHLILPNLVTQLPAGTYTFTIEVRRTFQDLTYVCYGGNYSYLAISVTPN